MDQHPIFVVDVSQQYFCKVSMRKKKKFAVQYINKKLFLVTNFKVAASATRFFYICYSMNPTHLGPC